IDVIGFYGEGKETVFKIFFIRNGVMTGTKDFYLKDTAGITTGELLSNFIAQFYAKEIIPPDEIVLRQRPDEVKTLAAWLSKIRWGEKGEKGKKVNIIIRPKGKKLELLKMAEENAGIIFKSREKTDIKEILKTLKERLVLKNVPHSIGGLDVSTISGSESAGAFVCWAEGGFKKDMYRHMKIRTVEGMDDYSMIEEITGRVIKNLGEKLPSFIIIDGGRGQLEVAKKAFDESGIKSTAIISIAKKPDRAFALSLDKPVDLEDRTPSSLLLKKIRDEAHRFAVSFHRKLRDKRLMESPLKKIPGIGEKRRLALLRHFGSIEGIRKASLDDIAGIKRFNEKIAEKVIESLKNQAG
ncbi:MAG: helix-hairpin-helix domain-containing protein, partial [Nitrospirota bacterium]|nr:helix-hairpin-helix domain-containing protein [Nitrospirota bacterium]